MIRENIKENTIEYNIKIEKVKFSELNNSFKPYNVTAAKDGIDNRNEIFAASTLYNLVILHL